MGGKKRIIRNISLNTLGLGIPLIVAIVAFPVLIKGMGTSRFGVLLLAWMVVGYFSVFDLGLGRAITKLVAEKRGLKAYDELPGIIQTSLLLLAGLGLVGAAGFLLVAPLLVSEILSVPADLITESKAAFQILAISIPIVVISSALAGVLEAHQRFGLTNAIRLPLGVATFLIPLLILPYSNSLVHFVIALVSVRAFAAIAFVGMTLKVVPGLGSRISIVPTVIPSLLRLGGWMTVSNLISPMLVYLDRFLVGAAISMSAVTYYTTPYEVVTKALLLPRAIMGVLFPEFAASIAHDPKRTLVIFHRWRNYIFAIMFPFSLIVVLLAGDFLTVWLGSEFANQSTRVLQYLAVGVLVNSLAQLAFGLIQGAGRADLTAKIHLFELPFYLLALWWMTKQFGINGTALAWTIRVSVDAVIMFYVADRILNRSALTFRAVVQILVSIFVCLAILIVGSNVPTLPYRLAYLAAVLTTFAIFSWLVLLDQDDRRYIRDRSILGRR
tara:strand:- start:25331 stop:26824 length:1494 start_codon:yes stop_codon:yes gene_type:complete